MSELLKSLVLLRMLTSWSLADAIADITATGSTMILNDLRPIESIRMEASRYRNQQHTLSDEKQQLVDQMLTRLEGVRNAKNLRYTL